TVLSVALAVPSAAPTILSVAPTILSVALANPSVAQTILSVTPRGSSLHFNNSALAIKSISTQKTPGTLSCRGLESLLLHFFRCRYAD
ncbi:hypothetical protein ACIQGW_07275, partial [Lysinibacillus xylanilyticus]|uniref:hypothetical protein n=1 Tax=Lysinibacillus xylanilyticus TaxID=582475 RepID=UPI0037F1B92C